MTSLAVTLTVYPDGPRNPGIDFWCANGFVSRVVSAIANSDQIGCLADARRVCDILNQQAATGGLRREAA